MKTKMEQYTEEQKLITDLLINCKYLLKFCNLAELTEEDFEKIEQAKALITEVIETQM